TTISLRDDVLRLSSPLVDDVTGHVYTPQERFRKYLSEGRQRDSDGNLQLSFALSLDGDESLFNPSLCVDRISGLRVSLVGAGLGAVQPELILEQRGGAFLRSCSERDGFGYVLTEYALESTLGRRRALVHAGINLSSPNDPNSPPLNHELYGRPVA